MPSRGILAAVCAAALLMVLPQHGAAQTSREVIGQQLEQAEKLADIQGFRIVDDALSSSTLVGLLQPDGRFMVEVRLEPGRDYLIEGFCDEDCTDIDLALFGPDGEQVAEDVMEDDVPELRFQAAASGAHYVSVHMVDCSADQCYYAVRVLRR